MKRTQKIERARCAVFALVAAISLNGTAIRAEEKERERRGVHWGAMPVFNYNSDMGLNIGGSLRRFNYGDEGVKPFKTLWTGQFVTTTRGPTFGFIEFEETDLGSDGSWRWGAELFGHFSRYQPYYGLGPDTEIDRALSRGRYYDYTYQTYGVEAVLRKSLGGELELEAGITLAQLGTRPTVSESRYSLDFGPRQRNEFQPKIHYGAVLERRNSEFIPSSGYYGAAILSFSPGLLSTGGGWARGDLEARGYLPLVESRWLWLAAQARYTGVTESAPLSEKARLGSLGTLRGLPLNRYLSNHSASLRVEARSVFIRWWLFDLPLKGGLGVFTDAGKIGASPAAMVNGKLHYSWGLSAFGSYFTDDFVGSADLGFSEGERALYLRLGHPF